MCRTVKCSKCNKTTWAGCGAHVDQVMKNVAMNDRCTCSASEKPESKSIFSRIFK